MKEALIMGLTIALDIGIIFLYVFGDSQLVIRQLTGIYEVRKPELLPYFLKAKQLMSRFSFIKLSHVPRRQNTQADALANLAAALTIPFGKKVKVVVEERLVLPPILELLPERVEVNVTTCAKVKITDWTVRFIFKTREITGRTSQTYGVEKKSHAICVLQRYSVLEII